jgi:bifunctional polynucleotide phosphatase/kinase
MNTILVHPFFQINEQRKTSSIWQTSFGSCKHAVSGNVVNNSKVAAFDLDGTIIVPKEGRKFPISSTDWQWWRKSIPSKLKELHDKGCAVTSSNHSNHVSRA